LLGIPYARAARFGAPELVPFDPARTYDAFGPAAPQSLDSPLGEIVPGMRVTAIDEHACLTLNVFAPDGARDLPVLVWFHGGSFVIGASAQPVYDGQRLADEQQVVVVTANYRLGALGFLDARPLGGVANCGVRDALAALAWTQANIASLGGDPARVTAWGESAGGGLVLHALASDAAAGLVTGAIVQSGATFSTLDDARAAIVRDAFLEQLNGDPRTAPVEAIVAAQQRAMSDLLGTIGMMPFHPMVDDDVVVAPPTAGLAVDVPLLIGTTSDEMRLFLAPSGEPPARERLAKRIARYAGADGDAAIDAYAKDLDTDDTDAIWAAVFSDVEMQKPMRAVLDAHPRSFNYLFTWEGPNVGACHGIDIPFPFGNFVEGWDAFVGGDPSPLSAEIRAAWAAFARTGDPGWPAPPATRILGPKIETLGAHPLFGRLAAVSSP
jgi:para-nitrobenzyl esterase